jgi:hypothetical protein
MTTEHMEQQEVWRAFPGSEGRYDVSSHGRVRSHLRGGRILRPGKSRQGYLTVSPVINGRNKPMRVHHMVLITFVGPRPEGMVCCHANDIPDDNRVENLRWDTPQNNVNERQERGYQPNPKLSRESVTQIRADTRSIKAIARAYGIDRKTVRQVKSGVLWKHVPRPTSVAASATQPA